MGVSRPRHGALCRRRRRRQDRVRQRSTGGNLFGGTGELRQGGAAVGRFSSTCIAAKAVRAQCGVTLIWTGRGRIQIAGSIRTDNDHNIASITGGSGEFRGARGTAELEKASALGLRAGEAAPPFLGD